MRKEKCEDRGRGGRGRTQAHIRNGEVRGSVRCRGGHRAMARAKRERMAESEGEWICRRVGQAVRAKEDRDQRARSQWEGRKGTGLSSNKTKGYFRTMPTCC